MCYYLDPAEMYQESIPKARKPHRCQECNEQINPGEKELWRERGR